jgi:hypothetical protein
MRSLRITAFIFGVLWMASARATLTESLLKPEVVIDSLADAAAVGISFGVSSFSWQSDVLNILVCRPASRYETVFSVFYSDDGGSLLEVNFPPDQQTDTGFDRIIVRVSRDVLQATEVTVLDFDQSKPTDDGPVASYRIKLAFVARELPLDGASVFERKCSTSGKGPH